jgi:CcmD family protein
MENLGYLFAAYTIIFIVIFLYVLFLWRRQTRLEAELKTLEGRLAKSPLAQPQSRSAN